MNDFIDRHAELNELDLFLDARRGQLVLIYGRRRVGKTALLLHWAERASEQGWDYFYWMPNRGGTAEEARKDFAHAVETWISEKRGTPAVDVGQALDWRRSLRDLHTAIEDAPTIVILDEFPYAVESDPTLPSNLQWAWDHLFQTEKVIVLLAGSHISMMVEQRQHDKPLYGRFTGQLEVKPMPYRVLSEFFPDWSPSERVSAYAVVGGIPAYLQRFNQPTLNANLRRHLLSASGMFRDEPLLLIGDLVRDTSNYESTIRAIARGNYTYSDIVDAVGFSSPSQLGPYLKQLAALKFIERVTPATMAPDRRRTTTRARYELRDPFLRFYYRFIEPYQELIEMGRVELLWERIADQFRSFVGTHTFEELAREWVWEHGGSDVIPFLPETVGQHWSSTEQIDVVAANWRTKQMLLGECTWGAGNVGRKVVTEFLQKAPRVVPDRDWDVHYVLFAREGFTDAARAEAEKGDATVVTLERLDADLHAASKNTARSGWTA